MENVLLTSSKFIKSITSISDNINDKMMLPSIRESQEYGLQTILGSCLYNKLKQLVKEREIENEENIPYKDLLEKSQYYLAYQTASRLCMILSYKIDNIGVTRTRDDLVESVSLDEVAKMSDYFRNQSDFYKKEIQRFLLKNRNLFPELSDCDCSAIHANLYSSESSGIFLGGRRGKKIR